MLMTKYSSGPPPGGVHTFYTFLCIFQDMHNNITLRALKEIPRLMKPVADDIQPVPGLL